MGETLTIGGPVERGYEKTWLDAGESKFYYCYDGDRPARLGKVLVFPKGKAFLYFSKMNIGLGVTLPLFQDGLR